MLMSFASVCGSLALVLGGPSASGGQEATPGKGTEIRQQADRPNALLDNLADGVIAGGVDIDVWLGCLRKIEVTAAQRAEITPIVRTYLTKREAWKKTYGPMLAERLERRRALKETGGDTSALAEEIQMLRKRNPSMLELRRAVWVRLISPQRAELVDRLETRRYEIQVEKDRMRQAGSTASRNGKGRQRNAPDGGARVQTSPPEGSASPTDSTKPNEGESSESGDVKDAAAGASKPPAPWSFDD